MLITATAVGSMLAGAAAVTYALLKRRVLDLGFVIGRALVVAGISAIVIVSFVLLEWLLGTVLASASHATGLVANAALALVLGLSMSFIHKRVDGVVDFVFFHKRHQDELALRDFAGEAAFVTNYDDLLDLVIETVRVHTDASGAAVMLDFGGRFGAARWFGQSPVDVSENDALILALKAKHVPADPHHYATALSGDVAFPLSSRGRLLGVLLCGTRTSGEAYSPDEIDALREMAHGIGSALGSLERSSDESSRDDAILTELRALRNSIDMLARERNALS
jgi:GAF domain-containing protein